MPHLLTITSDYGLRDGYVGAVKAVILSRAPEARLLDVSHMVAPGDVMQAAYVLREVFPFCPPGSVHLILVGAGAAERFVAARWRDAWWVAPDNGVLSLIMEKEARDSVTLPRPDPGGRGTFPGRDILAPAAAALFGGAPLATLGASLDSHRPMHWALPIEDDQGVRGWVVHVDQYGNCITNIPRALFESNRRDRRFKCYAGHAIIDHVEYSYAATDGDPVLVFNSRDLLEIAVPGGRASELLDIRTGAPVNVVFLDERV